MSTQVQPRSTKEVVDVWTTHYRALIGNYEYLVRSWLEQANLAEPTIQDFVSHYRGIQLDRREGGVVLDLIEAVHFELSKSKISGAERNDPPT